MFGIHYLIATSFITRRIGRWLTDVTPLFPSLKSNKCTFTMKTVAWAKAWKPSLNLRLSVNPATGMEAKLDLLSHKTVFFFFFNVVKFLKSNDNFLAFVCLRVTKCGFILY